MSTRTNKRIKSVPVKGWPRGDRIEVSCFTGFDDELEQFPVCLDFPDIDDGPCFTADAARALAAALLTAADLADESAAG